MCSRLDNMTAITGGEEDKVAAIMDSKEKDDMTAIVLPLWAAKKTTWQQLQAVKEKQM